MYDTIYRLTWLAASLGVALLALAIPAVALAAAADPPDVPGATWYVVAALIIRIAVGAARRYGLPARYGAPVAIALGALMAGADVLITGAPPVDALLASLAAASAAVATHELGESARGRYAPGGGSDA